MLSPEQEREVQLLRADKWNGWQLQGESGDLALSYPSPHGEYWLDLSRCLTSASVLDWTGMTDNETIETVIRQAKACRIRLDDIGNSSFKVGHHTGAGPVIFRLPGGSVKAGS